MFFFLSSTIRFTPSFSAITEHQISHILCTLSFCFLFSHPGPSLFSVLLLSKSSSFQLSLPREFINLPSISCPCFLVLPTSLIFSSYFTGDFFHFCLNSTHPFGSSTYHYQRTFTLFSYFFFAFLLEYNFPWEQGFLWLVSTW